MHHKYPGTNVNYYIILDNQNDNIYVDVKFSNKTNRYTHHQNGHDEKAMDMLKTKAKILFDEYGHINQNLLKGEAIITAFLENRIPNVKQLY